MVGNQQPWEAVEGQESWRGGEGGGREGAGGDPPLQQAAQGGTAWGDRGLWVQSCFSSQWWHFILLGCDRAKAVVVVLGLVQKKKQTGNGCARTGSSEFEKHFSKKVAKNDSCKTKLLIFQLWWLLGKCAFGWLEGIGRLQVLIVYNNWTY